jgi:hypothetical protein
MADQYRDTERHCPDCGSKAHVFYTDIPPHRREWSQPGMECVDHCGPARDYRCNNCDAEWTMPEPQA